MRVVWLVERGRRDVYGDWIVTQIAAYPEKYLAEQHASMVTDRELTYRAASTDRQAKFLEWSELDPHAKKSRTRRAYVSYRVVGVVFRLHVDQYIEDRERLKE